MVQDVSLLASIDSNMISKIFHLTIVINLWTSHLQAKLCDRMIDFWLYLALHTTCSVTWRNYDDNLTINYETTKISFEYKILRWFYRFTDFYRIYRLAQIVQESNHPIVQQFHGTTKQI